MKEEFEELNDLLGNFEKKVESLTQKVNEVVLCLEDNKLYRKVAVEYVYSEEEKEEETKEE